MSVAPTPAFCSAPHFMRHPVVNRLRSFRTTASIGGGSGGRTSPARTRSCSRPQATSRVRERAPKNAKTLNRHLAAQIENCWV
eukprot:144119-Pyramimonas_sp.AAC.1